MKGTNLGEFEELVLLTVGILYDNAYSVAIKQELNQQTGRKVTISSVHAAVYRLEEKGLLNSRMGEMTNERGGKRKRLFTISQALLLLVKLSAPSVVFCSQFYPRTIKAINIIYFKFLSLLFVRISIFSILICLSLSK